MSILYFILVLFVIVLVHEYGHYKTAKMFGVRVDEFGFGYPPKIATLFKRGETTFTLNALPFGGFVKIYGEDAVEGGDRSRALFSKPKWQQAIILSAGVIMNIILAWVIFLGLFLAQSGTMSSFVEPQYVTSQNITIADVSKDSVAERAGVKSGDVVRTVTIDGTEKELTSSVHFVEQLKSSGGKELTLGVERGGTLVPITLTPTQKKDSLNYTIGVGLSETGSYKLPFIKSIEYSFTTTASIISSIFGGLFDLIKGLFVHSGSGSNVEVSGPVGIVKTIGNASKYGIAYLLSLTALISLNLAVLNILPIPALDGGRLLFILIEKIKGRALNIKTTTIIHTTSFFVLVGLMLVVTFFDVLKLFKH